MKNRMTIFSFPYIIWMMVFILVPLFLILYFSVTVTTSNGREFTIANFADFFNPAYLKVMGHSLYLAFVSTLLCLILGYPIAYIISKVNISKRNTILMLFIIPMWMNFLLRTYAWMNILGKNGIINQVLNFFHLGPYNLLYNDGAVIMGMIYNFLPFMIYPIYSVLIKIDDSLLEASMDLGASNFLTFLKVTLPLSIPGILTGVNMVFMPAVSTFVISALLGGGQYMLIGNLIENQFIQQGNWHFGSAISIILMIFILISMGVMSKFDKEGGEV